MHEKKWLALGKGERLVRVLSSEKAVLGSLEEAVLGYKTRDEVDEQHLLAPSSRVLVFDPYMNVWVHRRSPKKKVYPGRYDVGVAETCSVKINCQKAAEHGMLLLNMTYEAAANRILENMTYEAAAEYGILEDETQQEAGERGVLEEMFNRKPSLSAEDIRRDIKYVVDLPLSLDPYLKRLSKMYVFHYNPFVHGEVTYDPDEIDYAGFYNLQGLRELLGKEQFMPLGRPVAQFAIRMMENKIPELKKFERGGTA